MLALCNARCRWLLDDVSSSRKRGAQCYLGNELMLGVASQCFPRRVVSHRFRALWTKDPTSLSRRSTCTCFPCSPSQPCDPICGVHVPFYLPTCHSPSEASTSSSLPDSDGGKHAWCPTHDPSMWTETVQLARTCAVPRARRSGNVPPLLPRSQE